MGKGIHGNDSCARCGACCIYFGITEGCGRGREVFKHGGEICKYLDYNPATKIASCRIHEESWRPHGCVTFSCWEDYQDHKDILAGLKDALSKLETKTATQAMH